MTVRDIDTPHGPARVHHHPAARPRGALVLGHGAGGSVAAPDLRAVAEAALEERLTVVLVEQPYRVAGRRSAAPAAQLDTAWGTVLAELRGRELAELPVLTGGRSSGARVACRTAAATGAAGVLCLAFPLVPPRRSPTAAAATRLPELEAVEVPVLVIQGDRDPFGMPPSSPAREVAVVRGTHALKADLPAVAAAARTWLSAR